LESKRAQRQSNPLESRGKQHSPAMDLQTSFEVGKLRSSASGSTHNGEDNSNTRNNSGNNNHNSNNNNNKRKQALQISI